MPNAPVISVIMPVYNSENFVKEAIESILAQTLDDFEFIIVNDGSSDKSSDILQSFTDTRIVLINNTSNIGNYPSRNKGLSIAKGKYICVMDADDISMPNRFEKQVMFMENNNHIGLAGSGFRFLGSDKDLFREMNYEKIKVFLLRNNCFLHPSLILRYESFKKYELFYDEQYYYSADYDLVTRAAQFFHITNIPEVLINYRMHNKQISTENRYKQMLYADQISILQLHRMGVYPDKEEIRLHTDFLKNIPIEFSSYHQLHNWLNKLRDTNNLIKYYDEEELNKFLNALLSLQPFCNRQLNHFEKWHQ